ncbi:MAG: hypothetical protein IKJ78_07660 [Bacteroidales bacterium]|nr:hypothetical protein [Bacteroidales bacterium]
MTHLLSKSKYIRGLQCERALWLDVHEPRLARYTAEQMRRFDRGRDFEYAFKAQFPDGIDLSAELGRNVDLYPARTAQLLDLRPCSAAKTVLFEAGFQYDDVLVLADVVCQRDDGSLDIYEVKSGTTLSDTYRRDAALQHYVISHCRRVNSFSIVYNGLDGVNGANGQGGQDGPFVIVDLTLDLAAEGDRIAANIAGMKTIVRATAEPDTPTGQHCLTPYACPYQHYCAQGVRQMSLF